MEKVRLRLLVECAVVAALSVILSYLRLWQMPQGGSITLESLPVLLLALWRGPRAGPAAEWRRVWPRPLARAPLRSPAAVNRPRA